MTEEKISKIINPNIYKILKIADTTGYVTFSKQKNFAYKNRVNWTINILFLYKLGIVEEDGRDGNNEKVWKLTEIGKRFLSAIDSILNNNGK